MSLSNFFFSIGRTFCIFGLPSHRSLEELLRHDAPAGGPAAALAIIGVKEG